MFAILVLLIEFEFFGRRYLVLNCLFVINSAAVRAGTGFVGSFEAVEAKLTYLKRTRQSRLGSEIELDCNLRKRGFLNAEEVLTTNKDIPDSRKDMV